MAQHAPFRPPFKNECHLLFPVTLHPEGRPGLVRSRRGWFKVWDEIRRINKIVMSKTGE